jgi:hypothetical protein
MNTFAMIFGRCVWTPPSPKAAFLVLSYFFGTIPNMSSTQYEAAVREQMVAAGSTEAAAAAEVGWLNECFAKYPMPKHP